MQSLKLYIVKEDYVKYLYGFDSHVMYWKSNNYKTDRKYVGVVLELNGFKYFAPLSSPKENDYYYKDGVKLIRKNIIPIIRLVSQKNILLGKIKLSSMIPVQDNYITLYDLDLEPDKKYKDLITDELICIRKHKAEILKNAKILYNQKSNGYENISYLNTVIDFKVLENACLNYKEDL